MKKFGETARRAGSRRGVVRVGVVVLPAHRPALRLACGGVRGRHHGAGVAGAA